MATTNTYTNFEVCAEALRKIGVLSKGETPEAEDFDGALKQLGRMLKAWQSREYNLWAKASGSLILTTAASYTLDPVRPLRILSARLKRNGIEMPMVQMTRDEYDELPQKDSTGTPTQFYYNRQREEARFFVWPVLAAPNGETIEYTYERELADVVSDEPVDVPSEWYDAVVYGLAARLADDYMIDAPRVIARAEEEFKEALSFDREGSVIFGTPEAYY